MIKPAQYSCPVCCTQSTYSSVYSIGNCKHLFCQTCCIQHIQARLTAFQSIRCLQNNCPQKLTNQSKVYKLLSQQTKNKFQKYQQFLAIQQNSNLKPCNKDQCFGVLDKTKVIENSNKISVLVCNLCKTEHCPKCYSFIHNKEQKCKQMNEEDKKKQQQLMKALNFRKCPSCSVWVQKNGGCQYLTCKCKTQFCFVCGSKFQHDPCRKNQMHEVQRQIRQLIRFPKYIKKPTSTFDYICLIPKTLLKFILIVLFTILSGIIFMVLAFGILIPLLYLIAPAGLVIILGQIDLQVNLTCFLRILTILLYPIVGFIVAVAVFFVFLTYPIMRMLLSLHLYDEMDRFMHQMSSTYLKAIRCMLSI